MVKWMDLPPQERHKLIGEIIDAMIYHAEAVAEVKELLEKFRDLGYIRNIVLPDVDSNKTK
jgi:hypothetical protein